MALTPGFKKFVGLIVVVGAVGGGLFYWKTMPKKAPQVEQVEQQVDTSAAPAPQVQPPAYTQAPSQPVQQAQEPEPIQAQPAPQADASSNRGMQFLLNQGQK